MSTTMAIRSLNASRVSTARPAARAAVLRTSAVSARTNVAANRTSLVKSTRGKSLVSKAGNDQIKETVDNLLTTATEKWEETEDKPAAVTLATAGLVTLIVVSSLLGALDKVPFLGSILELVGIGYSAYFAYNNLLFTPDREKLASKVNEIKDKVL